jgi:shikimate dehydrogenase
MRVFPKWAEALGLDARIEGVDLALHDEPEAYRRIVEHIKQDPLSLGALVTTHKLDLLEASSGLFDELGPYAARLGEVSCISKRETGLFGEAMDPISSGLALDAFLSPDHWMREGSEALILGAGGSSLALTIHWIDAAERGEPYPPRVTVTNRSPKRLEEMEALHSDVPSPIRFRYRLAPSTAENDRELTALPSGSLVVNATGLGKDRPGSPLTDAAQFPRNGLAWDFNYRGDLRFLVQARAQAAKQNLHVEDGWVYFLHGWTRVISEVFHTEIPTSGATFERLSRIARDARSPS